MSNFTQLLDVCQLFMCSIFNNKNRLSDNILNTKLFCIFGVYLLIQSGFLCATGSGGKVIF
jgi:hypothetical protein